MIANEVLTRQQLAEDYQLIERALAYLENHYQEQPSLEQIASQVGLSEYHFQRVFTRWVGISPKRFLQFLTKEHARQLLDHSSSVLDATYRSGLSSPGRLHDLFVTMDAVTPGEYKLHGAGLAISYGGASVGCRS
jgi:AraC family transcriptional regulator of adaptative response/methylated-DNA-[protein]-cysteine methyltransferase